MPSSVQRPWYREPMLWLVLFVPAATVVAGITTLVIAIRAGGLDAATDRVVRTAQVQQTDLAADRQAQAQGLSASVQFDGDQVAVQVLGTVPDGVELNLQFVHPARAGEDRSLALTLDGDRWVGQLALPKAVRWNLTLRPSDDSWRLDGELRQPQGFAVLTPRFADG